MKENRGLRNVSDPPTEADLRHALAVTKRDYGQLLEVVDFWYQKSVALQVRIKELETELLEKETEIGRLEGVSDSWYKLAQQLGA